MVHFLFVFFFSPLISARSRPPFSLYKLAFCFLDHRPVITTNPLVWFVYNFFITRFQLCNFGKCTKGMTLSPFRGSISEDTRGWCVPAAGP